MLPAKLSANKQKTNPLQILSMDWRLSSKLINFGMGIGYLVGVSNKDIHSFSAKTLQSDA
ncbi:MAG: hypothetical protein AAFX80_11740 [Cyanobacteria bacterium J06639_18]